LTSSRLLARAAAAVTAVVLALPTSAVAQTSQQVKDAENRVAQVQAELDAATAAYEEVWARVEAVRAELVDLEARGTQLEAEAAEVGEVLSDRARLVYKYGSDSILTSMMSADGPQGAIDRASMLSAVTSRSQGRLQSAVSLRKELDQVEALRADKEAELSSLLALQEQRRGELQGQLQVAEARAADLRERAARQRAIDNAVMQGLYACIHDYNSFRDTWGAPRSGGRRHKGVDVMAPYGVPVYAFTNGRISRLTSGGLGGISLYMWGDDGNEYFYTHLAGYAAGIYSGKRVEAGEHIAINGDTGNARGTPHVHFEVHPGGGAPVNPYPYMAAACR
jgi:murein DD-endopeptidase MepM/ murein hydrolase activator NlpD